MKDLLTKTCIDIFANTESKRDEDHPITELHTNYNWIGKNRQEGQGGGIGFMYNKHSVSNNDENVLNSKSDDFE